MAILRSMSSSRSGRFSRCFLRLSVACCRSSSTCLACNDLCNRPVSTAGRSPRGRAHTEQRWYRARCDGSSSPGRPDDAEDASRGSRGVGRAKWGSHRCQPWCFRRRRRTCWVVFGVDCERRSRLRGQRRTYRILCSLVGLVVRAMWSPRRSETRMSSKLSSVPKQEQHLVRAASQATSPARVSLVGPSCGRISPRPWTYPAKLSGSASPKLPTRDFESHACLFATLNVTLQPM